MGMLKNKKGWVARDYLIATLLFSGVIVLMYLMVGSMADSYGNTSIVDAKFRSNFDNFQNNTERITKIFDAASSKEGLSLLQAAEVVFGATFSVISLIFSSLYDVGVQIFHFTEYFGVPAEVSGVIFPLVLSILTVMLVFIIISAVNKTEKL